MRELTDRRAECGVLDGLVEAVRAGESRVLVVHGEAGVGKTALLEYLADRASLCRVLRVSGVQSEMELAFAGLHQLCAPLLERLRVLPGPQQEALRTAFGISGGPAPDRFLVGLASLGLLAEAAEERPVVCLADDAQWLDRASAQALAFVARRLGAESVGLVFSARVADGELATLPELEVKGLPERDARALLDAALTGPVDARVREQIVAETRGNPLALLELPRVWTPAELAGGFGLPGALPGRIEDSFRRRVNALPAQARRLLLLAAADPTGDARDVGELDQLPMLLNVLAVATALRGDLAGAAALIAEADAAREATSARLVAYAALVLAAFRGSKAEAVPLIEATLEQAASLGQGAAVTWAYWVTAVLHNGLGLYQEALAAARQAAGHKLVHLSVWALPELVVAAARTGNTTLARDALDQLSEWTQAGQTDWGLGIEARSRALLSEGEAADRLYLEAIDRLGRTDMRPDLARTHLLYGEWLRRQRRRGEARVHLRTAHGLLDAMGMEGFAARARHELRATGETARRRSVATMPQLTAQEAQIARLARDGLSNPEIGVRLFLSPRTVQYHLGKAFIKLDITSRGDLRRVLPADPDAASLR